MKGRVLASRKNSRLLLTDDPRPASSCPWATPHAGCTWRSRSSVSKGEDKLVVSARQIEIKATDSVTIEGARIDVKASGELAATGQPIRLN